jgi:hypothetical protein
VHPDPFLAMGEKKCFGFSRLDACEVRQREMRDTAVLKRSECFRVESL